MHAEMSAEEFEKVAAKWLGKSVDELEDTERLVLHKAAARRTLARNLGRDDSDDTLGQKLADKVASFGGSWPFIIIFLLFLALWAGTNLLLMSRAFDPYPFIFLNLMLSMLAALQAPVIMMSQNRQAEKDREAAEHDYEVNLKAEIEIMALHAKIDALREEQFHQLLAKQQEQIDMLTRLVAEGGRPKA